MVLGSFRQATAATSRTERKREKQGRGPFRDGMRMSTCRQIKLLFGRNCTRAGK